ncbi:phosphate acyltransferase PlsX [Phycisphaera mikurensis]|uniref:Phosphate acyltransferase n=1 Tax=Phycisphaera mikurensis (strain NBRC 102666 / KCTC 22515 / FYK2301M01) TaxID=1142394 RepID=I0IF50_PHYMF|nr:phosphate acyltransferase PlsX [Phycisphaera mikurensis]MBB6440716.1 glycerol-3-phosphate acyltransferase PlsX [Phycisphaera mikurensis]BAM03888.1 phosphate acyltransferase [Phycisphaera mikurensis NBRC 102666]
MRIALDVMGGDNAPDAILSGALAAADLLGPAGADAAADDAHTVVLIGDRGIIEEGLEEGGLAGDPRYEIEATTEVIGMAESPTKALRGKSDSSIVRMAELGRGSARGGAGTVSADKACDAIISAGNTGACVAAAQMQLRRLPGVHRPGIAVVLPTFHGPVVVCDVGANPEPRAQHLHQYAHMASVYAERIIGVEDPKVSVMNIGGEEEKGTPLVRETNALCRGDEGLNYVGYVEGRELFEGKANVVVTEGFTGNVVLKLAEGLSAGIFKLIAHEIFETDPELAMKFEPVVKKIYAKHDYHEYGGAPLLGANGICMICHGSSEPRTIRNTIRNAIAYQKSGINEAIVERLGCSDHARGAGR